MATMNGDMKMGKYDEKLWTEQLLDAQAHIWKHTFSFINSMSLKCAVQLGIADIIHDHGRPMSLSKLVDALPIDKAKSQYIHRLMRLLAHSEFFVKQTISNDEEECYWLTPASRLLLKDAPMTSAPRVLFILDAITMEPWQYMSEWLVNGHDIGSAFEMAHGNTPWEHMGQDSRLSNLFNETMACDGRLLIPILLKDCKQMFEGVELVVDVGGGIGSTAKAIIDVFPTKKCIVLELPHVVAGLESTDNLIFVEGNMFESVPQTDVVLLKWVLHDWSDEDCVRILKKCREAICGGNTKINKKVMIIEMVVEEAKKVIHKAQLLYDMAMMTYVNGKERSEKEWAKLFTDAGFSSYKISPVLGLRSVIEVYP